MIAKHHHLPIALKVIRWDCESRAERSFAIFALRRASVAFAFLSFASSCANCSSKVRWCLVCSPVVRASPLIIASMLFSFLPDKEYCPPHIFRMEQDFFWILMILLFLREVDDAVLYFCFGKYCFYGVAKKTPK